MTTNSYENRRILIIDDNESIHADIRKTLCSSSTASSLEAAEQELFGKSASSEQVSNIFELDSAYCGEDGLSLVRQSQDIDKPYAAAFVDMRMPPGWDGLETIERIWQVDSDIQIVVCTAFSDHTWQEMIEKLGQTDRLLILKKPFDPIEVLQCATALARKWQLAQQARDHVLHLDRLVEERTKKLTESNEALKNEIAVRVDTEKKLHHAAMFDGLTDLPNRTNLLDMLGRCIEMSKRCKGYVFAVLFVDLDNFKRINDTLGHDYGDAVLVEVATRLKASLRSIDQVCRHDATASRLGGDEFVIILEAIRDPSSAIIVAERMQKALNAPFRVNDNDIEISASIGVALYDSSVQTPGDLLRNADTAMYRAKQGGKCCHALFNQELHEEIVSRLLLENDLRKALDRNELKIVYQPIINLETGRIDGLEALMRWHPTGKSPVPPGVFIPIAEEINLIGTLGRWSMTQACQNLAEWNKLLPPDRQLFVAVNVAPQQFADPEFVQEVSSVITQTELNPQHLHLEITEGTVVHNVNDVVAKIKEINELGTEVNLDDFGSGYSSLGSLYELPLNLIKIDRMFVFHAEKRREYAAVIGAVMVLARNLNMQVVAEGVETKDQLAQILAFDCDYAQGYYFAKPLDPQDAWDLIQSEPTFETNAQAATKQFAGVSH